VEIDSGGAPTSLARNSAAAESEGGQKFLPPNPLPFCPPERFGFAREARNHSEFCSKNVRTSSKKHRQLGNEVIGSPATRARQPFFGEISSRFEFSIKFEPTFLRNARICILSPCDKRILAWLLNNMSYAP
jgi:hypothetical protein